MNTVPLAEVIRARATPVAARDARARTDGPAVGRAPVLPRSTVLTE